MTVSELLKMRIPSTKDIKVITSSELLPTNTDMVFVSNGKALKIKNGKKSKLLIDYNKHPKDWLTKRVRFSTKMTVAFTHNIRPDVVSLTL